MLVVAAPGHRLAGHRVRQARLLAGECWLGFPPSPGERDSGHSLARQLIRVGLDGADVTLIDSLTAQKRLAQAGFGLALVPESSVREELRQGALVVLDIPSMRITMPITAIHRRNGYVSSAAKALLKILTEGVELDSKIRSPPVARIPDVMARAQSTSDVVVVAPGTLGSAPTEYPCATRRAKADHQDGIVTMNGLSH